MRNNIWRRHRSRPGDRFRKPGFLGFRAEAAAAGIQSEIIDEAFAGLTVNSRVYELNDNQPEFSRAIWDYLDRAVSETRVSNARTKIAEHRSLLSQIENTYGVDSEIIVRHLGIRGHLMVLSLAAMTRSRHWQHSPLKEDAQDMAAAS